MFFFAGPTEGAGLLGDGQEKSSKTIGELFKNEVRTTKEKVGSERGPGLPFGVVLAPFSMDFGPPERKSQKKSREKQQKKMPHNGPGEFA